MSLFSFLENKEYERSGDELVIDIFNTNNKYNIIYADPPWKYGGGKNNKTFRVATAHYSTMKTNDICELPINKISENDSILFLWVTPPQLIDGLKVMNAWGFKYKTVGFTWVKTYKNGKPVFGLGFWTRSNAEFCLIGVKGHIKRINNNVPQLIISERQKHSKKPDEIRSRIVDLMGDLPRIELFARQESDGWDCWGDEI